jgi:hypothetical protein
MFSCLAVGRTDSVMVLARARMFRRVHNYDLKKELSCLAISGNGWGGSTSSDVLAVHNYDLKKKRSVGWSSVGMIITT